MKRLSAMTFCVVLAVGVLGLSGQAHAGNTFITHPDQFFFTGDGSTTLKLTNFESAYTNAWSDDTDDWVETTTISVGSYLRGIFIITSSQNDSNSESRFADGFELTGEFSGRVSKVTPQTATTALFEIVPDAAFEAEYGTGAMVQFFHDTTEDFTGTGSPAPDLADSRDSAVGGSKYLTLGANGTWGTGYYWNASGAITPGVASFAASLDLLTNNSGLSNNVFQTLTQAPAAGGAASLALIENFFALQGNTVPTSGLTNPGNYPWQLRSQDPLRATVIPLPSAVWAGLAMLGLLGYSANRRRKRNV